MVRSFFIGKAMITKSISVIDIEECGFKATWTMLSLAVPYFICRSEIIKYAIDVCTQGIVSFPEVDYLAGLSADDIDEINETLEKLSKREEINIETERSKLKAVILFKDLTTCPAATDSINDEFIIKENLIDLWLYLYEPKDGDLYFGKYDEHGILREDYTILYCSVKKWVIDEIERLLSV